MTQSPSEDPIPRPPEPATGEADRSENAPHAPEPTFGRSMGALWLYTILRFLVFGVLFGLLWLFHVPVFLAAVLALLLSIPLSYVLLAKPRAALAETIEARLTARRARSEDLSARLKGDDGNPS